MLERDYLVNYYLTLESQQRLYRKAEEVRLAKLISAYKTAPQNIIFGTLGTAVVILLFILFM